MPRELALTVDMGTGEPQGVDVPSDMTVDEFLSELRRAVPLTGDSFTVFDKQLGRDLTPSSTLEDSGVGDGHQLLIRPAIPVVEPEALPAPPGRLRARSGPGAYVAPESPKQETASSDAPVEPPPRRRFSLQAVAAMMLAAVLALLLGFYIGQQGVYAKGPSVGVDETKLQELARRATALESELATTKTALAARDAQIKDLTTGSSKDSGELTRLKQAYINVLQQLATAEADLKQSRSEMTALSERAQQASTNVQAEQEQIARQRAEIDRLNKELADARSQAERRVVKDTSTQRVSPPLSGLLIWSGPMEPNQDIIIDGRAISAGTLHGQLLPGVPVNLEITPDNISVVEAPSERNGWKRIVMRSARKQKIVVTIRWTTAGRNF